MCRGTSIPNFKINVPFFCCLLLFLKDISTPRLGSTKMVNEYSVDYQSSQWGLTSSIHPFKDQGSLDSLELSLSLQNICWIFSQTCIYHHVSGQLSNLWYSDYWKMHLRAKKLSLGIFIHANPSKTLPQLLIIIPQVKVNYSHPPGNAFFEKLFPPQKRGEEAIWSILLIFII